MEQHVRRVVAVAEVAEFIDDQKRRVCVAREHVCQPPLGGGPGEVVDHLGGGDEQRLETALDMLVGGGNREMGFTPPGLSDEDQRSSVGNEIRREDRAEQIQPQRGLEGEIELLDRLQEREAGTVGETVDSRLPAVSDFLARHGLEELPVGPRLTLGAADEFTVGPASVGQAEPLEQRLDIGDGVFAHEASPMSASCRMVATYSAP
jgi:hypothetical protein